MLMARLNPELIGRPLRIKEILMQTTTTSMRGQFPRGAGAAGCVVHALAAPSRIVDVIFRRERADRVCADSPRSVAGGE